MDPHIEDVASAIDTAIDGALPADLATEDIALGLAFLGAQYAESLENPAPTLQGMIDIANESLDNL